MDESQQQATLSSAYPDPPSFFQSFTEDNLTKLREITAAGDGSKQEVPHEFRFLIPPEPPTDGKYRSFGDQWNLQDKLPSLADAGIDQLYPDPERPAEEGDEQVSEWTLDRAAELKKLTQSLLLNFLELIETLSVNPELYGRKIEDLRTIFINIHHLLNEYRPHQARETLILMMEEQLKRTRDETEGIRALKSKVEEALKQLPADPEQVEAESSAPAEATSKVADSAHLEMWKALRDL